VEDDETNKKKLYYLVVALIKQENNFKKGMSKFIETVLRTCRKEKKKKKGAYKQTPKQIIKTLA